MSNTLTMRNILLMIGLSMMGVMINIDYTAVNLALVTIANDLHAPLDVIQWVLSGYVLAWAAAVIPAGKIADNFGQRRMCVVGLTLFMLSSVMAGLASSAWMINLARILQGISGAIFVPTLYAMLNTEIPSHKIGFAMGIFSLGVGTGAAIGPTFGGFFLKTLGWSWIFYINVPITLLAMTLILFGAARSESPSAQSHRIPNSAYFLSAGLVVMMYTISQLHHSSVFSSNILLLLLTFAVLFSMFIRLEKQNQHALIPLSILKNRNYLSITMAFSIEQFCFSSSFVALGLFMQNSLHYTPVFASVVFLALSGIFAVISSIGGMFVDKVGVSRPALLGFILLALGSYGFLLLPSSCSVYALVAVLLILGAGMGFVFAALNTGMVTSVESNDVGVASSVFIMMALVGNALGVVVTTLVILAYSVFTSCSITAVMSLVGASIVYQMHRRDQLSVQVS